MIILIMIILIITLHFTHQKDFKKRAKTKKT